MYPEFNDLDGGEEISFPNEWLDTEIEQVVQGADCFAPFASLNEAENLVVLKLSEQDFTEMLSALYVGAQFTYPEKYLQVVANLLKGVHCPPLLEEQECYEYPSYSSFVRYSPMSPFVDPNTIPDGYATQPFLANGVNGNDFPNYELNDVIVPTDAISFDANWFDDLAGVLPTIEIVVSGPGTVFIKFLTIPLGGLVVVTVDNPPNLADIVLGIVSGAENIIDLNQDLVALPPETAQEIVFEVVTEGTGIHTIYAVFLPILDDSLIPIRFGGGFRGLQLCNFVPEADMGIQNLRFMGCDLEQQNSDGTWSIVTGWENWLSCVPSGGGGGGGGGIAGKSGILNFASAQNFTNTGFANLSNGVADFLYTPTKSNMLVIMDNIALLNSGGANTTEARVVVADTQGIYGAYCRVTGTNGREQQTSDWFTVTPNVQVTIRLQTRVSAGTGTLNNNSSIHWIVLEFDDASELFVEDIRISGGELQKKIGGVWINVTDSFSAIISAIQTTANNALAAANSAILTNTTQQSQINSIISVNNSQNTRLTNLESFQSDAELSFSQINLTLANHETRIDALEAAGSFYTQWKKEFDFTVSPNGWENVFGSTWSSNGFAWGTSDLALVMPGKLVSDSRVLLIELQIFGGGGSGGITDHSAMFGNTANRSNIRTSNLRTYNWLKCDQVDYAYAPQIFIEGTGAARWLEKITIYGVGTFNPFA